MRTRSKFFRRMATLVNRIVPSVGLWLTVLLAYLPVVLIHRQPPPLTGDEAYYARTPLEMLQRDDLVAPYFNGKPRFKKPPLAYWAVVLSYRFLGVWEPAARLPSLLAVLITALLLTAWSVRYCDPANGSLTGPVFLLMPISALLSQAAVPETLLTLFVTLSSLSGWIALQPSVRWLPWSVLSGIGMGCAFLSKGLPGFLPVLILLPLIFRNFPSSVRKLTVILALAILTPAPWLLTMHVRFGEEFWQVFLLQEHLQRVAAPMEGHRGPFWYYLPVLLLSTFPWSLRLLGLWGKGLTSPAAKREPSILSVDRWMSWWVAAVVALFSLSATKLPHYIFPAVPACAWLGARSLTERAYLLDLLLTALFLIGSGTLAIYAPAKVDASFQSFLKRHGFGPAPGEDLIPILTGGVLFAAFLVSLSSLALALSTRMSKAAEPYRVLLRGLSLPFAALLTFSILLVGWSVATLSGGHRAVAQWLPANEKVTFGPDTEWVVFYAGESVQHIGSLSSLRERIKRYKGMTVLARIDQSHTLRRAGLRLVRYGLWVVGRKE